STMLPGFFRRYDLDGIVSEGDYEPGVLAFVRWLADRTRARPGVAVRREGTWLPPDAPGSLLPARSWALPDIDEIPHRAYDDIPGRDRWQPCGVPGTHELVVPVARGCPMRCHFCEVWRREGVRERRLPVARVVAYIDEARARQTELGRAPFDHVAMYAPT